MEDIFCTNIQYDNQRILDECRLIDDTYGDLQQINLTLPDDWCSEVDNDIRWVEGLTYGAGSLYVDDISYDKERRWGVINPLFTSFYLADVIGDIGEKVQQYYPNTRVARARIMKMKPKTCLTYHKDADNIIRAHVPIITSRGSLFIHDRVVSVMDRVGVLYLFNTTKWHTAINATKSVIRTHLVVNFVSK